MTELKRGIVFVDGTEAATIEERPDGMKVFAYLPAYLASDGPAVSITLPKSAHATLSRRLPGFLDGLIPEGWTLNIAKLSFPSLGNDRMELLLTVCEDCIGAVQVKRDTTVGEPTPAARVSTSVDLGSRILTGAAALPALPKQRMKLGNKCLACLGDLDASNMESLYHTKCSLKLFGTPTPLVLDFALADIEALAFVAVARGHAVTGAQRKISLSLPPQEKTTEPQNIKGRKSNNQKISNEIPATRDRMTVMGVFSEYILKPPSEGCSWMPANEQLMMQISRSVGIRTAESGLIPLASGELCYVTRRFDRLYEKNAANVRIARRLPLEDFGQLFDQNVDMEKYKSSTEKLGRWLAAHATAPGFEAARLMEQTFFAYLLGNCDAHLKNFAVLTDACKVTLSPAYDSVSTQIIDPDSKEQTTLAVNGKKNGLTRKDWEALAENLGLPKAAMSNLAKKYVRVAPSIFNLIERSFMPETPRRALVDYLARMMTIINATE